MSAQYVIPLLKLFPKLLKLFQKYSKCIEESLKILLDTFSVYFGCVEGQEKSKTLKVNPCKSGRKPIEIETF